MHKMEEGEGAVRTTARRYTHDQIVRCTKPKASPCNRCRRAVGPAVGVSQIVNLCRHMYCLSLDTEDVENADLTNLRV